MEPSWTGLKIKTPESSLSSPSCEDAGGKGLCAAWQRALTRMQPWSFSLILNSQPLTLEKSVAVVWKPPSLRYLLQQPKRIKAVFIRETYFCLVYLNLYVNPQSSHLGNIIHSYNYCLKVWWPHPFRNYFRINIWTTSLSVSLLCNDTSILNWNSLKLERQSLNLVQMIWTMRKSKCHISW